MNIPKKIHYCWFGGTEKNELIKKCIDSWKRYCPDYEIVEWNENNFDLSSSQYVMEAYNAKKWAFVSDYVRMWALYNYGGIYLDTDVEILKPLDKFLIHDAFTGFEKEELPFTAVVGCVKKHEVVASILSTYEGRRFLKEDGTYDMQTNTESVSKLFVEHYGVKLNNLRQDISNGLTIYPSEYFCPKSYTDNTVKITKNTYAIHWFDGSWMDISVKDKYKRIQKYNRVFGERCVGTFIGVTSCIKKEGFWTYLCNRLRKITKKK